MKREITEFKCDSCGKQEMILKEAGYPYAKGWFYLYSLNMQVPKSKTMKIHKEVDRIDEKDMHFCSLICFDTFVQNKIKEATKMEVEDMGDQRQYSPQEEGFAVTNEQQRNNPFDEPLQPPEKPTKRNSLFSRNK